MTTLVGRDAALNTLLRSVAENRRRAARRVATIVAPAGLGKSALLTAFREALAGHEITLLTARPLEVEGSLAFAALTDLLADLPPATYDELPGPQRAAIRAALLLDDAAAAEPRAIAAGLAGVLSTLASRQLVALVIDDAQWLDDASASALALGLRRLGPDDPVVVIAAARPGGRPLAEWLPDWPRDEVPLPPLSMSATFHVVREHLGIALDRGELRAVQHASAGNPLHALEFARHRATGPDADFEALLTDRILALPRPTRRALLAVAMANVPSVVVVAKALEVTPDELLDRLEPAVADRLVRPGDNIRFRHPLYLEAAVEAAAPEERRALHFVLAKVEPLAEARVRHLAEVTEPPDPELADRLDESARRLWERAGWSEATDLMRLAVSHTPPEDSARRSERTLQLAAWLIMSGCPGDAEGPLRNVRATATGSTYWEGTIQLAELLWLLGRPAEATPLVGELLENDLPIRLRARMLFRLDLHVLSDRAIDRETFLADLAAVNTALRAQPDQPGLVRLRAEGLALEAALRWADSKDGSALLAEAIELDAREPATRIHDGPHIGRTWQLIGECRHDDARALAAKLYQRALDAGDDLSLPEILLQWGYLEARAGAWAAARDRYDESVRVAESMHQEPNFVIARTLQLGLAGLGGEPAHALTELAALKPRVEALGYGLYPALWWQQIGEIQSAVGEFEAGYDAMRRSVECWREALSTDPLHMHDAGMIDAAIGVGDLDLAQAHLADALERVASSGRAPAGAELERSRVALLAARGHTDEAIAAIPAMLAGFDGPHRPLERAKAYLLAGMLYRRNRAKRLAHESLSTAKEAFDRIGCPPYAARATAELGRVGLRPQASTGLTDSELHIARLAASGLRNTEIADAAFISAKTVESTLSRCYRKLGIRSRAELARALEDAGHSLDDVLD